jgi:hypothetical protein
VELVESLVEKFNNSAQECEDLKLLIKRKEKQIKKLEEEVCSAKTSHHNCHQQQHEGDRHQKRYQNDNNDSDSHAGRHRG